MARLCPRQPAITLEERQKRIDQYNGPITHIDQVNRCVTDDGKPTGIYYVTALTRTARLDRVMRGSGTGPSMPFLWNAMPRTNMVAATALCGACAVRVPRSRWGGWPRTNEVRQRSRAKRVSRRGEGSAHTAAHHGHPATHQSTRSILRPARTGACYPSGPPLEVVWGA